MTPEEARRLLDGTTPGPWFFDDDMAWTVHTIGPIVPCGNELECSTDDAALAAHAPDMAAMVAGMRTEYRAEEWRGLVIGWVPTSPWTAEKPAGGTDPHTRIVRRYVTTPEEA